MKFGPSGNDIQFYEEGHKHSLEVFEWLHRRGLSLYEYSFGRGIQLSDETALIMAEKARKHNIEISVHAPYFINFATDDEASVKKSVSYIMDSLKKLKLLGGTKCVVHVGSCKKLPREQAIELLKCNVYKLMKDLEGTEYKDMLICPESMGKIKQIGTYSEIFDICQLHKNLVPTLDFGHINCIERGGLKKKEDFRKIFDEMYRKLSREQADKMHIHFSKIEYGDAGEIRHLTLEDTEYGPEFLPLAQVLCELEFNSTLICESKGVMAQDAITLKNIYEKTRKTNKNSI